MIFAMNSISLKGIFKNISVTVALYNSADKINIFDQVFHVSEFHAHSYMRLYVIYIYIIDIDKYRYIILTSSFFMKLDEKSFL